MDRTLYNHRFMAYVLEALL